MLEGTSYLSSKPILDLDEIVTLNMELLSKKRIRDCKQQEWELETDRILHCNLLGSRITDIARPRMLRSNLMQYFRRAGIYRLEEVVQLQGRALNTLLRVVHKDLLLAIKTVARIYKDIQLPQDQYYFKIKDAQGRWADASRLTSRQIREIFFSKAVVNPKLTIIEDEVKRYCYGNIHKITNVKNKSRLLRLLQGDVYCAERLFRFGLSDNDQCKRCFEKETILHLLTECPYSKATYELLGINGGDIHEVLGVDLSFSMLEIRADILNYLIFRQHMMPPEVLVRTTLEKYKKGLVNKNSVRKAAERLMRLHFG